MIKKAPDSESLSIIYTHEELDKVIDVVYELLPYYKVFTFQGDLGSGKTTLIKALLKRCAIKEVITSPTFSYVAYYTNSENYTFYHFDLYRIKNLESFIEYGFDEYLYQENSWAFIEWPEVVNPLIGKKKCSFIIEYLSESNRLLKYRLLKGMEE